MFKTFEAFLLGMTELRCAFTTCMHSWDENQAYDRGREAAHMLTLRRFES